MPSLTRSGRLLAKRCSSSPAGSTSTAPRVRPFAASPPSRPGCRIGAMLDSRVARGRPEAGAVTPRQRPGGPIRAPDRRDSPRPRPVAAPPLCLRAETTPKRIRSRPPVTAPRRTIRRTTSRAWRLAPTPSRPRSRPIRPSPTSMAPVTPRTPIPT